MNNEALGIIYGLVAALLFSLYGIFIKMLYRYNIDEYSIFAITALIALIFYGVILIVKNKNPLQTFKINKREFALSFINCGVLALFLGCIFSLMSFKYINNGLQRAVCYSSPIFILILERIFFKKKFSSSNIIALSALALGFYLIINYSPLPNSNIILGVLFASLSAFVFSIYSIITERIRQKISDEVYWFYAYLSAFIWSALIAIFKPGTSSFQALLNPNVIMYLLATSILSFVIPYYILSYSIQKIGARKANTVISITPILAMANGFIFLNEKTNAFQLVGFIAILIGLILVNIRFKRDAKFAAMENT